MLFICPKPAQGFVVAVRTDSRAYLIESPEIVIAEYPVLRCFRMGKLFENIRNAVQEERYLVSWHADVRCEERGVTDWQIVAGLEDAKLVRE